MYPKCLLSTCPGSPPTAHSTTFCMVKLSPSTRNVRSGVRDNIHHVLLLLGLKLRFMQSQGQEMMREVPQMCGMSPDACWLGNVRPHAEALKGSAHFSKEPPGKEGQLCGPDGHCCHPFLGGQPHMISKGAALAGSQEASYMKTITPMHPSWQTPLTVSARLNEAVSESLPAWP